MNEFTELYKKFPNEKLFEIIENPTHYRGGAPEAAMQELSRRNVTTDDFENYKEKKAKEAKKVAESKAIQDKYIAQGKDIVTIAFGDVVVGDQPLSAERKLLYLTITFLVGFGYSCYYFFSYSFNDFFILFDMYQEDSGVLVYILLELLVILELVAFLPLLYLFWKKKYNWVVVFYYFYFF